METQKTTDAKLSEQEHEQSSQPNRKLGILIICIIVAALAVLIIFAILPMREFVSDTAQLRLFIEERGLAGVLMFMGMVMLQIFSTVIPAGPFEIAAGAVFGIGKGILICTIAMALASSVVFFLSRKLGMKFALLFFSQEKLDSMGFLRNSTKRNLIIVLLYLVPGAPKDVITFIAGMTDIPYPLFLFACSVCRIPSILLTVLSGNALATDHKGLFVLLILLVGAVYGLGILWIAKSRKKRLETEQIN